MASSAAQEIQPFQHLCQLLKTIEQEENDSSDMAAGTSKEASNLVIGLTQLIQLRREALNLKPPVSDESTINDEHVSSSSSSAQSKEDMSKYLDRDFSCFFCRTKCYSKEKFFSHFRSHFSSPKKLSSPKQEGSSSQVASEPEDSSDGMKTLKRRRKFRRKGIRSSQSDDIDSGCHSVESSSYSSDMAESDCFLGDSESSDSDENGDESRLERKRRRLMMGLEAKSTSSPAHHHHHHHRRRHLIPGANGKKSAASTSLPSCHRRSSHVSKRDRLSLAEKQLDNNETEGLICLTCLKRFSNCQNLRRHLRLHIARDSLTPDIERGDREDEDNLEGKHICDWCPARFDNRSAARIHETSHKGDDFKCYVCDKLYADRYSLRYHLRTHGIGRQIRCEYCNKSFSKPSRLEAHVRSHHNNIRDFKCSECDKAFKTAIHLKNHFRQHSGERPFVCSMCHISFRHKASLITHMRSHDGARPFCCELCGKTFREPSTLKAHRRVHTGDKPYKCPMCDKAFTQRAGLNYHKQMHSGVKPFKCQLCSYTTAKGSSLSSHYRNIHQLDDHPPIVKEASLESSVDSTTMAVDDTGEESSGCSVGFASDKRGQSLEMDGRAASPPLSSTLQHHHPQLEGTVPVSLQGSVASPQEGRQQQHHQQQQRHLADESSKSQLATTSAPPLPSPPVQSGDAIFHEEMEVTGRAIAMGPSSASNASVVGSVTALPSFDHLRQNSPVHMRYNLPSPGASSICSSGSTSNQDQASCFINNGAYQHTDESPPLTPPSNVTTAPGSNPVVEDLLPSIGESDFLPSLNITELSNQLAFADSHNLQGHNSNAYGQGYNSEELWPRTHHAHMYAANASQQHTQYAHHHHHSNQLYFNQIQQPQQQQQQQQQHYGYGNGNFNCCTYYTATPGADSVQHFPASNSNGTTTSDLSQMTGPGSNGAATTAAFPSQTSASMSNGNSNAVISNGGGRSDGFGDARGAGGPGEGGFLHTQNGMALSSMGAINNAAASSDQTQSTGYCI